MLVSKLSPKRVYNTNSVIEILETRKTPRFGNLIFFLGYSKKDLDNFLSGKLFNMNYYNSLYIPKKFLVANKTATFDRVGYYKNILEKYPGISITRNSVDQYRGRNLIVDLTPILRFFNLKINARGVKKYKLMDQLISGILNDPQFANYNSQYIVVPLDITNVEYNRLGYDPTDDYIKSLILPKDKLGSISNPINNIDFKLFLKNKIFTMKHVLPVSWMYQRILDNDGIYSPTVLPDARIIFYNTRYKYIHTFKSDNPLPATKTRTFILTMLKINNSEISKLTKEEIGSIANIVGDDSSTPLKIKVPSKIRYTKEVETDSENNTSQEISVEKQKVEKNTKPITRKSLEKDEEPPTDDIALAGVFSDVEELSGKQQDTTWTEVETATIEKIKEKRKTAKYGEATIDSIIADQKDPVLKVKSFPKTDVIHEEFKKSSLVALDKQYKSELLDSDIVKAFSAFEKDPQDPMIVESITSEDTSDNLNYKITYTVNYRNKKGKLFKVVVDLPTVVDERYLFLNGGKKTMTRQIVSLPLIKNKPDEVFVCTNYNKFQIIKKGNKLDKNTDSFIRALQNNKKDLEKSRVKILPGDNLKSNSRYVNTSEYNYISQQYSTISLPNGIIFNFNRREMEHTVGMGNRGSQFFPVGYNPKNKKVYIVEASTGAVYEDILTLLEESVASKNFVKISDGLIEFISEQINTVYDFKSALLTEVKKGGKSFMFSTVGILKRRISLLMLLAYYNGFFKLLEKYKVSYKLVEKNTRLSESERLTKTLVPFKDYNFIYDNSSKNNMLLHALGEIPTREYNISSLNSTEFYLDYFEETYKSRNVAKGFRLILDRMVDPITFEILNEMNLPNDITGLLLQANTLLSNVNYIQKNNMSNYRIRGLETLPVILFRSLASEFNKYRMTGSFSLPRDRVLKNLLSENIVNEYSVLNISNELMEGSVASWKGPGGINSLDAYTPDIRSYDPSMMGVFGSFSPIDSKVGTVRHLSYNTSIKSLRGFLADEPDKNLDATGMFSPAELINPFNATMSDPMRTAFNVRQTSHIIPTNDTDAPLIGTGVERMVPFVLGSDFIHVAKKDGHIKEIDEKNKLLIIQYKDGFEDVVDLSDKISKNSQGGFYISNNLETDYKVGQKFKEGDILAKNNTFFKGEGNDINIATGTLTKVAMLCLDGTMEDGSLITENLSEKLTSHVTMQEELVIGVDTNIKSIVKVGDHVKVGSPLAIFETVFDDSDAINLIDKIGDKYKEDIKELSFTSKKAHYSGVIVDIRFYYNRELTEFSDSVRKLIRAYTNGVKEREKKIKKLNLLGKPNIFLPSTGAYDSTSSGKIKSREVDGLLIEFYIKHADHMHLGDKITFQGACKTIVTETIPKEMSPYSEFRPEETIDAIFSPLSVITRMTVDIPNNMLGNKALVELKKKVSEIYYGGTE